MKKIAKVTLSLALVLVVLFSITAPVSAATVKSVSYSTTSTGGNKATVFYVNTNNKNTTKIKYTCTVGDFLTKQHGVGVQPLAGFFEILIYGRNSTSESWTYLSKTNMKNTTSQVLSMKGYTQYKVRVYAWKTSTIGSYLGGRYASDLAAWCDYAGKSLPKCTFTAYSNVKTLAK